MDLIFDILFEGFFELIGEGFISLCSAFVPNRALSSKARNAIKVIFFIISIALFCGLIIGIILLVEAGGKSFWGWLAVSLAAIYLIIGIVLKIKAIIKE